MKNDAFRKVFVRKLNYYMGLNSKTQTDLMNDLGLSSATVSSWCTGKRLPRMDKIQLLADYFGINKSDLVEDKPDWAKVKNISVPAAYALPILGTICCGDGIYSEQNFSGSFFVDNSIRADFCLDVKGDSMIEAGIRNGDKAFIRRMEEYRDGLILAVFVKGDDTAMLKKVYRQDGKLLLLPCNHDFSPQTYPEDDVHIFGEVVGVYHAVDA